MPAIALLLNELPDDTVVVAGDDAFTLRGCCADR